MVDRWKCKCGETAVKFDWEEETAYVYGEGMHCGHPLAGIGVRIQCKRCDGDDSKYPLYSAVLTKEKKPPKGKALGEKDRWVCPCGESGCTFDYETGEARLYGDAWIAGQATVDGIRIKCIHKRCAKAEYPMYSVTFTNKPVPGSKKAKELAKKKKEKASKKTKKKVKK